MDAHALSKLTVSDLLLINRVKSLVLFGSIVILSPAWIGWALQIALSSQSAMPGWSAWLALAVVMAVQIVVLLAVQRRLVSYIVIHLSSLRGFTQDVAHELSTPVGLLDFRLQIIERDRGVDQIPDAELGILRQALERMKMLVEDFRLLAKSERPVNPGGLGFVKVDSVVRSVCDQVAPLLVAKNGKIDTSSLDSVSIIGERERLERAILNLLTNAARHLRENGTIKVSVKAAPTSFDLIVKDDGVGIAPDLLPHVFERFKRAGEQDDSEPINKGSGLGLAIVKAIVESHGGSITAESTLGQGAAFCLHWPKNPKGGRFTQQILTGSYSDD